MKKHLITSPCLFDKEYPGQYIILHAVTLSIGLVHIPYDSHATLKQIIIAAGNALYQAKNEGKNKIISISLD